jgi:hypothetical protein
LIQTDKPTVLVGVMTQTRESIGEAEKAVRSGRRNIMHWQLDGDGTYYVTVNGDFLAALQALPAE